MKFIFILFIFLTLKTFGQEDSLNLTTDSIQLKSENKLWKNLKYDVTAIAGGTLNGFIQPVRWEKDDFIIAGATAAGLSVLYLADEETSKFFRNQSDDIPESIKEFGWIFGRPEANYSLTAGVYLVGLITDNEKIRETGVLLVTSSIIGGVAQQTMKTLVGRGRPDLGKGQNQFRLFRGGHAYGSFPSGHTILSTTTIYALSKQFENPWIKGGLYTIGLVTPVSRLWAGAHWLTDVTLSLVMSVAIVEGVDSFLKRKQKYGNLDPESLSYLNTNRQIKWNLNLGPGSIGLVGVF